MSVTAGQSGTLTGGGLGSKDFEVPAGQQARRREAAGIHQIDRRGAALTDDGQRDQTAKAVSAGWLL